MTVRAFYQYAMVVYVISTIICARTGHSMVMWLKRFPLSTSFSGKEGHSIRDSFLLAEIALHRDSEVLIRVDLLLHRYRINKTEKLKLKLLVHMLTRRSPTRSWEGSDLPPRSAFRG